MSAYLQTGARLSECGQYRYALTRRWEPEGTRVLFVMLNPSTADADQDDPTIRRCVGFAKAWGHAALAVANLFAYRATQPAELYGLKDPVGPGNDDVITKLAGVADMVVAAWGTHGSYRGRDADVLRLLQARADVHVLALTKQGHPAHPLYQKGASVPVRWRPKQSAWEQAVAAPKCPCGRPLLRCDECGVQHCNAPGHLLHACEVAHVG